jgi:hypothetical protein
VFDRLSLDELKRCEKRLLKAIRGVGFSPEQPKSRTPNERSVLADKLVPVDHFHPRPSVGMSLTSAARIVDCGGGFLTEFWTKGRIMKPSGTGLGTLGPEDVHRAEQVVELRRGSHRAAEPQPNLLARRYRLLSSLCVSVFDISL